MSVQLEILPVWRRGKGDVTGEMKIEIHEYGNNHELLLSALSPINAEFIEPSTTHVELRGLRTLVMLGSQSEANTIRDVSMGLDKSSYLQLLHTSELIVRKQLKQNS